MTSIVGTYNGVANPSFTYDANGLMTAGAGQTVTATSFNIAATNTAAFAYDPEHARYRMVTTGLNAGTTYYLNDPSSGAMEERPVVGGVTTWHDYIMVECRMVAERFCTGAAPCASGGATLNYFVLDHLGSITVITDAALGGVFASGLARVVRRGAIWTSRAKSCIMKVWWPVAADCPPISGATGPCSLTSLETQSHVPAAGRCPAAGGLPATC